MAFVKKTWKDRIVQYANRRLLTKSGGEVEQVTVTRDEGTISEAGDIFDAATMNDLEQRIDDGFDDVDTALSGKADSSMFGDITGVSITCPRCPIASISNLKVKKAGDMVILGANLNFGASQAGNVYLLTSLFGNNTYCSGTLYDNATDKTYLLGKGTSTSIWVREGANAVSASEFSNKSNIIMTVYGIL